MTIQKADVSSQESVVDDFGAKRQLGSSERGVFLSVVIPVYRAEKILPTLCRRLNATLEKVSSKFEIILVDDRSPDGSWKVLRELVNQYPNLIVVRLSRNFGQHYASTAGLDMSRGEWTVIMDCDLQDQPEEIPRLLEKAQEGFDIVLARRSNRQDKPLKKLGSFLFWWVFSLLAGFKVDNQVGSFRVMGRNVVDAYCSMRERARIFGGLIEWLGFTTATVDVTHASRFEGKSSYNLRRLLRMSLDGIIAFSNRPLYAAIIFGSTLSVLAGCYGMFHLIKYICLGYIALPGWLSTVTLMSFIGGLILLNQGILGIYIGRIYDQAKQRPIYVVDKMVVGREDIHQSFVESGLTNCD